jgi:hypothetical protein
MSGALARPFKQRKFMRVVVPDGDRERAAGVPDEYRFEVLLEQAKAAASQRARPVSATSLCTYLPTWRRWMSWAFDDWLERGGGAVAGEDAEGGDGVDDNDGYARGLLMNPYKMDVARIERFVCDRFGAEGKDGLTFTVSIAKTNKSALVNLAEAFAWLDAQRFKQRREEVENMGPRRPDERRAAEMELHRLSADTRWRLCWPDDLRKFISGLEVWWKKKREVGAALKELSKGGAGKSKFNEVDALARSLDNRELHYLHEWIRAARSTSASDYAKWARVRWFILAAEAFLTRPGELFSLRRAQLKMHTLYEGMLGAGTELFVLEMPTQKGSQDTTTPVNRYALRHRDVRCCAISALAECLFISFHGEGGKTLQVAERVTAAQHAQTIRDEKTRAAFEAHVEGEQLLWRWQLDLVCPGKTDRDPPDVQKLRDAVRGMRLHEEQSSGAESWARVCLCDKLLHRRAVSVTKATMNGAPESDLRQNGGWAKADAMQDAYILGPAPRALCALAGCDASVGLYWTDYDRDRLHVPDSMQRRVFPWIEDVEKRACEIRDAEVASDRDYDVRIMPFLACLRALRRVLLQDLAFQRAAELEEIERGDAVDPDDAAEAEANALREFAGRPPPMWSMWSSSLGVGVFVDDKGEELPEWAALVADARQRMKGKPIPDRVRVRSEFIVKDVGRHMADASRQNESLRADVQRVEHKMDDLVETVRALIGQVQGQIQSPADANVLANVGAALGPASDARPTADPDPEEWALLLKSVSPKKFEEDVVAACNAWAQLQRLEWRRQQPNQINDANYRYALFYRAIEGWALTSGLTRAAALTQLHRIQSKLPEQRLASLHAVFFERMKLNREKMRQCGDYHKAGDQPFVLDFATRLSALVRGDAEQLYED